MSILDSQHVPREGRRSFLGVLIAIIIIMAGGYYFISHRDKGADEVNAVVSAQPVSTPEKKIESHQKIIEPQYTYSKMLLKSIENLEERPDLKTIEGEIKREPMALALKNLEVHQPDIYQLIQSMKKAGYNFKKTRPGETFVAKVDQEGKIWEFYHYASPLVYYYTVREQGAFLSKRIAKNLQDEEILVSGTIEDSIYNSIVSKGQHPNLVIQLADYVFKGGEVDFFSDCQKGDRYAISVIRRYYIGKNGKRVYTKHYGDITGVYYKGSTVGNVYAFIKEIDKEKLPEYYNEKGKAIQRAFLKYPFTFKMAMSSGFGMRRDPVTRRFNRMHKGVDFPAKIGTPIISVAKGRVIKLAFQKRGAGRYIRIRHKNGYETEFFHLSRVKKGLRVGSTVHQGEVVCYTGNTGRSTGPHLHYGMRKNGKHVNPMTQKFNIKVKDLPVNEKDSFMKAIIPMRQKLEQAVGHLS